MLFVDPLLSTSPGDQQQCQLSCLLPGKVKKGEKNQLYGKKTKYDSLLALCQNLIFSGREVRRLFMLPCTHTIPSLNTQVTKDGKVVRVKFNS